MSDMSDDELLGSEGEDDDGYHISNEQEEALLQDQDEEDNKKKEHDSESDEHDDDVLNLLGDLQEEEEFRDDEKDEPPCVTKETHVSNERPQCQNSKQNVKTVQPSKKCTQPNRGGAVSRRPNFVSPRVNNSNKMVRNGRRNRGNGRGSGRGNYQARNNFVGNGGNEPRRRNGTVLINPRYEGTVHVNENARLKTTQNNILPWINGNTLGTCDTNPLLIQLANSLAQTTHQNLFPQQQAHNFYEPPPSFEPPPHIEEYYNNQNQQHNMSGWNNSYVLPNQGTNSAMLPPAQHHYPRENQHQSYNNNMASNRLQKGTKMSNSYSNYNNYDPPPPQHTSPLPQMNMTNSYDRKNQAFERYDDGNGAYNSNYSHQNDFQNKSTTYCNDRYQNKNPSYNNFSAQQDNYSSHKYNYGNDESMSNYKERSESENVNYRSDFKQNQLNAFNNVVQNNGPQNQFTRSQNKSNNFTSQKSNNYTNRNFGQQQNNNNNKRFDVTEIKHELPEKKLKTNVSSNDTTWTDKKDWKTDERPLDVVSIMKEAEEDEETRLYRMKIEEQKRERERVLQMKEERRKQMILERQKQNETKLLIPAPEEQQKQKVSSQNFQKFVQKNHSAGTVSVQRTNQFLTTASFQKPNENEQFSTTISVQNQNASISRFPQKPNQFASQSGPQKLILSTGCPRQKQSSVSSTYSGQTQYSIKPDPDSTELPNLTFKVSNDHHTNASTMKDPPQSEPSSSNFMSNRVVVVKNKNTPRSEVINSSEPIKSVTKTISNEGNHQINETSEVGQVLSSFFNNRKVLKKDNELITTRLVVVNNLSTTINQNKLMALSRGIGEIQKLRVDTQERQATILFKSVASAHAFFKKYQRRILDDLSVIEVKLEPML